MNKILLIGLCLLVAALGFNVASAADLSNGTISDMNIERNVECINYKCIESVDPDESADERKVVENGVLKNLENPAPNMNPNPFINRYNYDIDMRNESNQNHNSDNNPIAGKANESDINKPSAGPKIIDKTKTFKYRGEECFLALVDTEDGYKLHCYKTSAGMNGAGASCVEDAGNDLIEVLEEEGILDKWGYELAKDSMDTMELFQDVIKYVFDYDFLSFINDSNREYYIILWTFGEEKADAYLKSNSNT